MSDQNTRSLSVAMIRDEGIVGHDRGDLSWGGVLKPQPLGVYVPTSEARRDRYTMGATDISTVW